MADAFHNPCRPIVSYIDRLKTEIRSCYSSKAIEIVECMIIVLE